MRLRQRFAATAVSLVVAAGGLVALTAPAASAAATGQQSCTGWPVTGSGGHAGWEFQCTGSLGTSWRTSIVCLGAPQPYTHYGNIVGKKAGRSTAWCAVPGHWVRDGGGDIVPA
ncbi:hypothetical protein ACH4SP_02240 [Streptomyces sp. NPDC021093]|uniref:hypothetical protein n=1 Tax=Streptomyces sp. NPDC021093 TaxID=3365112 RepID=UPI0037A91D7C